MGHGRPATPAHHHVARLTRVNGRIRAGAQVVCHRHTLDAEESGAGMAAYAVERKG